MMDIKLTVTSFATEFLEIPVKQPNALYGTTMQFERCVKSKLTLKQNHQTLHNGRGQIKTAL
jgi:hypothetical protein